MATGESLPIHTLKHFRHISSHIGGTLPLISHPSVTTKGLLFTPLGHLPLRHRVPTLNTLAERTSSARISQAPPPNVDPSKATLAFGVRAIPRLVNRFVDPHLPLAAVSGTCELSEPARCSAPCGPCGPTFRRCERCSAT